MSEIKRLLHKSQMMKEDLDYILDDINHLRDMLEKVDYDPQSKSEVSAPYVIGYCGSTLTTIAENISNLKNTCDWTMTAKIYKITTFIKSNTDPRKWFDDTLSECLEENETILDLKIKEIDSNNLKSMWHWP